MNPTWFNYPTWSFRTGTVKTSSTEAHVLFFGFDYKSDSSDSRHWRGFWILIRKPIRRNNIMTFKSFKLYEKSWTNMSKLYTRQWTADFGKHLTVHIWMHLETPNLLRSTVEETSWPTSDYIDFHATIVWSLLLTFVHHTSFTQYHLLTLVSSLNYNFSLEL